ncbi:MAG TPA: NUDIX hydrolase [Blastocatellia bacterium]|nr:NUDIX hydrolase [Blastocatellia bacterium]
MNREPILEQLRAHRTFDSREEQMRRRIADFVTDNELFYSRSLLIGHLTGSAWVLDEDYSHALLTHHGRLDLWAQLGGHVEDDPDMLSAAWREAREESGLDDVRPVSDRIFDVDVHGIPASAKEPGHNHYDIRFLFTADRNAPLAATSESKALRWVALSRISELTREESILRMIRKTEKLRENTKQTK